MFQPICEICGQPAMVHVTEVRAGRGVVHHLCEKHGRESLPVIKLPTDAAQTVQQQLQELTADEREQLEREARRQRRATRVR